MTAHTSSRSATSRLDRLALVTALAVLSATLVVILVYVLTTVFASHTARGGGVPDSEATGVAGGHLPDGTSVFDDTPGVTRLDSELLAALRDAATDAAVDDVHFVVNSGWRSSAYQQQLLTEAISQYGSEEEAARWVSTPTTSAHVHGDAVDIGSFDATAWLSERGATYGLCQIYVNEPWHYELRPDAIAAGCPDMFIDPTEDPRTHVTPNQLDVTP